MLYILGGAQAILLCLGLVRRRDKGKHAKVWLIWLLVCMAVVLFQYAALVNGVFMKAYIILYRLGAIAWYAIPPLLLMYTRNIIDPRKVVKPVDLVYFIFPIFVVFQLVLSLFGASIALNSWFDSLESYTVVCLLAYLVNALIFSVWSIVVLWKSPFSDRWFKRLRTYRLFLILFSLLVISGIIFACITWSMELFFKQFEHYLLLCFALFVITIAYHSIRYSPYVNSLHQDTYGPQRKKELELKKLYRELDIKMRQGKIYLNRHLDLATLSKEVGIPINALSQIFTQFLGLNFYSFLHSYRLKEWEELIVRPENQSLTIAAVAENAGFRSKASFYKAFKEKFDMTPTDYLAALKA